MEPSSIRDWCSRALDVENGREGRGRAIGYSKRAGFLTNAFRDGLVEAW